MLVTEEREENLFFELGALFIFVMILFIGACVLYIIEEEWLPAGLIVLGVGLFWAILAFFPVKPAFAGLVFRLGSRVIISETVRYFRIIDGQEIDVLETEFNSPDFDPEAPDVKSEVVSTEYLTKKEGWTLIFPILERIVQISLRQQQWGINEKKIDETEEAYTNRAESFSTAEGVSIFPEIFYSYKVINPGKVFELGAGINENGDSPFLVEMLHDLVIGGTRGVLAKMELEKILSRETKDDNGNAMPIGEKIRGEIVKTPNFDRLGAELLILRIEDIKFTKEAQDVLNALEGVKKERLKRETDIIEADKKLEVQKKNSETLINKSQAELTEARNKALALNAAIAAFVGRKVDESTTAEDGEKYGRFQIGMKAAESLTGAKIIPVTDASRIITEMMNVVAASRPDASKPS